MGNKDNQWGLHDFEKYTYTDTKDIKTYKLFVEWKQNYIFFCFFSSKLGIINENLLDYPKSL
jgi:hypothetical protein